MTSKTLPSLAFLVAVAIAVLLSFSIVWTASLVAAVGITALFLQDYARQLPPLSHPVFVPARRGSQSLPLAA